VTLNIRLSAVFCFAPALALAVGCADKSDGDDGTGGDGPADIVLDPAGDDDGDGHTNGYEDSMGSDPLDPADVPYAGGWAKSPCADDLATTGDAVGQTPSDFALVDQYGEDWHLHDFCGSTVMLEFSGFT
jgi:hypothetical protein